MIGLSKEITQPSICSLEVRAYDHDNNFCSATIAVSVLEPQVIPSITVTTTVTNTVTITDTIFQPGEMNPIVTFILGVGIGSAAVLMLVVVPLKRSTGRYDTPELR